MELIILFGLLFLFLFLGMPIAVAIGLASLGTIFAVDLNVPLTLVPRQTFTGMNSFALMAIPFFILAGEMANAAGLTQRIINLALAAVGHIRGSLAQVNIAASLLMAGVSGSGAADTAALGTVLIPQMERKGYPKPFAVAVTAASATVGPIIPPSVLFVLYGSLTNVSVGRLFVAGALPGFVMGGCLMVVAAIMARKHGYQQDPTPFSLRALGHALVGGVAALIVPFIIVGAILTGYATATEAGVVAVAVALILGLLFFKTLRSWSVLRDVLTRALHLTAVIFFIIATSGLFANVLTRLRFQGLILDGLTNFTDSPLVMLVSIVGMLMLLGLFIDVTPLLIMFAAPLAAVAAQIGYDPVFFGVIVVISATLGAITPPVGGFLIIASGVAGTSIAKAIRPLLPFFGALVVALALLIAFPQIVTWLPSLLDA